MPTPEHNPQSIPPSEIPPGWRLCRESEREKLPADAKFWDPILSYWPGTAFKRICPAGHWAEFTYITATPLPESEREVTAASPWIPRSVREPRESDFPIYLGKADTPQVWFWATEYDMLLSEQFGKAATHWMPGPKLPAPPPTPVKTQREKDYAAYSKLQNDAFINNGRCVAAGAAYAAALETERAHFGGRSAAEVKAEIERIANRVGVIGYMPTCLALRALLSPPKEGGKP